MTDDLVKRLRDHIAVSFDDRGHVFEDEVLCDDAADRIEELEAKLAKAVEALTYYAQDDDDGGWLATETLAELTGGKDE